MSRKRAREDDELEAVNEESSNSHHADDEDNNLLGPIPVELAQPRRKRRRTKRRAPENEGEDCIDLEAGVNLVISGLDNVLLSDYLTRKTRLYGTNLTAVELSDLEVPSCAIKDTTSWKEVRTADKLTNFLEAFVSRVALRATTAEVGSPHTLIVTHASLRAAQLVREAREYDSPSNKVLKLFAKHFKMHKHIRTLGKTQVGIGVGTPQRLIDLANESALVLDKLERIVVDASHIDLKKKSIMDSRDGVIPLVRFLCRPEFMKRYDGNGRPLTLLFY